MRCPVCLTKDTKVTDSRIAEDGFTIKRRRECQKCNFRFSTYEQIEILNLFVIKRNGSKEPYVREKLRNGLIKSLEKRPYTQDKFSKLVNTIERDIQKKKKDEITSLEIGELVMKRLKGFDKIAYIRFASIYRSFEDVRTFQKELNDLMKNRKNKKR
ncbi:MAG: transcriptional regulator NrdR [Candidatus Komeilibacteria bacterium CG10_big_fil_rev_8_21_14_0_10_41_13]|uniref:Transcriptional repressor NrdR n=1 Tax=Candidatus Komeilibacteria bacterium CG10_big_fil_rev_8_21_14_0_10_41_13 TaxID=1974476 RepID=A0A2M6WDC3_9BACT|nr:MAG: transcriptional regulator NrdR [Candidatus Komeilibacteria bacterium CG10_big_fil_rev_8_21_14_0_10_41_13]